MLYDTIAEGIKAAFEDAKAEGIEVGKAEGIEMGKAEVLADVVAHRFPDEAEAFRQFLLSADRGRWPEMSDVLAWTGTGTEFMDRLTAGQSDFV